ncbi:MAG: EAL domain-containing protein [Nitriliruptoraceae bacterium]
MPSRPGRIQTGLATAVAVGVVGQIVLPVDSTARGLLQVVPLLLIVGAVGWGLLRLPPTARAVWAPVAFGLAAYALGDVGLTAWRVFLPSNPPLPNLLHLFNIVGGVAFSVGLYGIVRRRGFVDLSSVIDTFIVGASTITFVWVVFVSDVWDWFPAGVLTRVFVAAFPLVHVLVLIAAVRLVVRRRPNTPASLLLAASGLVLVVAAIANGLSLVFDWYAPGRNNALWLLAFGLGSLAVVHRSAPQTPRPIGPDDIGDQILRTVALVIATMLLPITMLLVATTVRDVMLAGMTAVILLLMAARIRSLLQRISSRAELRVEKQALHDQRRFSALVRHMNDVLIVVDEEGGVTYASPSAERLYGTDPTGWSIGDVIEFLHESERRSTLGAIVDQLNHAEDDGPVRVSARLLDRDDQAQYVDIVAVDLRSDPDVQGIVLTMQETTERDDLMRQVRELALRDPLTGLGNRALFNDRLTHALTRTRRRSEDLALLMCDLDDFKDINDTLGHAAGDRLLVEIARRFQEVVRSSDTVARLGGDEFAVLCEGVESDADAGMTARRLLEVVDAPFEIDGHHLRAGLSVGIAVDDGSRDSQELLRDADIALYEAKRQGKRRWTLHRPTMTEQNQARLQMAEDLTHALADGELEVAYQPIIELATSRIVAVEALARWNHPERGPIEPDDFIEIAEASGLVSAIGRHLLEESLETLRCCLDTRDGLVLRMAVNLSSRELREPALVDHVVRLLEVNQIEPQLLVLEVTETNLLDDAALSLSIMRRLRTHGVRFAIDDFGTGYSSLSYLRRLPVDIIKIDRSFIADLGHDQTSAALIRAIVELGRSLELDVCGEGVETEQQRDLLIELGTTFAQGFWHSRPMPAAALIDLLSDPDAHLVVDTPAIP